jgi:hypothetical protein
MYLVYIINQIHFFFNESKKVKICLYIDRTKGNKMISRFKNYSIYLKFLVFYLLSCLKFLVLKSILQLKKINDVLPLFLQKLKYFLNEFYLFERVMLKDCTYQFLSFLNLYIKL